MIFFSTFFLINFNDLTNIQKNKFKSSIYIIELRKENGKNIEK